MFLQNQHSTFHIEQSRILLFEKYSIEETACIVQLQLDEQRIVSNGFYYSLYVFIARCCVTHYDVATFSVLYDGQTIPLFSLKEMRGNKLALMFEQTSLYTIGKSSSVVKNKDGLYDEHFSKQLEAIVAKFKQNKPAAPKTTNMLQLLTKQEADLLSPYVLNWTMDYMPKEKALHFLMTLKESFSLLQKQLQFFFKPIHTLHLHNGLKGSNGYFDPLKKTIGLYYKYDRPLVMQAALFHEYGHFLDFCYLENEHNEHYIEERQKMYEKLLTMPTLKTIATNRELTAEHIDYLLSIEEVIARLFESYMHTQLYNVANEKEFAFTIEESNLCAPLFVR